VMVKKMNVFSSSRDSRSGLNRKDRRGRSNSCSESSGLKDVPQLMNLHPEMGLLYENFLMNERFWEAKTKIEQETKALRD
jgi:hypothetical protein